MKRLWAAVAVTLVVGGCVSSAPLRFYTLSELGTQDASGSRGNAIRVGRVKIPAELDRSELVQRIDANRVRIADQDRWAAPLDDMIRRVLTADLQMRGVTPGSATAAVLSLDVEEFIGDSECAVTLRASWELKGAGDENAPPRSGHEVIRVPARGSTSCTAGDLPQPMSQAVADLSERILAATR